MKKTISIILLSLSILSVLVLVIDYTTHKTAYNYWRFHKTENGRTTFNWWALVSPHQIETQKLVMDSVYFKYKVPYPVAPKFDLVVPKNDSGEDFVGNKIAQAVNDTLRKITYDLSYDYDGTAQRVRNANSDVPTLQPGTYSISMSLVGTASPESAKDGLRASLMPGHIEKENVDLAQRRLNRTVSIIRQRLEEKGITHVTIKNLRSLELQLDSNMVDKAIADPSLLDGMRYVEAAVTIKAERVVITPLAMPIFLPLWLGLLALLLREWHRRSKIKKITDDDKDKWKYEPEGPFWDFLNWIGVRRSMKYWYVAIDHNYEKTFSGFVIASRDYYFPAFDAHEKIKIIMSANGSTMNVSLNHEIHHHIRISKYQFLRLLGEETKRS